jgi:hypothetical protein
MCLYSTLDYKKEKRKNSVERSVEERETKLHTIKISKIDMFI